MHQKQLNNYVSNYLTIAWIINHKTCTRLLSMDYVVSWYKKIHFQFKNATYQNIFCVQPKKRLDFLSMDYVVSWYKKIHFQFKNSTYQNVFCVQPKKNGWMYGKPVAVTRLGLWWFLYHSWHKLRFYKKIKRCKIVFWYL